MPPTHPTPTPTPTAVRPWHRRPFRSSIIAGVTAAAVGALVAAAVLLAGPATAQTETTLTPITPVAPPTTVPVDNPASFTAGVLFFVICAVIIVGALILYIRNRAPRPSSAD